VTIETPSPVTATDTPHDRFQPVLRTGLLVLALIFCWKLTEFILFAADALQFPFSIDYGEGIVWQQLRNIVRGTGYAPLQTFPAVVYHYPPVFHLTAAAVAWISGQDPLFGGRLVELISTAATGLLIALLTMRAVAAENASAVRRICGALAALSFLTSYIVVGWAPLMRVDMLSGALGLLGILLALRALDRPAWIYAAALAFVLSVYTKQTSIAAPIATFAILLFARRRTALAGIGTGLVLTSAALIWLSWTTNEEFVKHTLFYNINRFDASRFTHLLEPILFHLAMLICTGFGTVYAWRRFRENVHANTTVRETLARDRQAVTLLILLTFLGLKTLMNVMILKVGANDNYLIEWLSIVAVFFGMGLFSVVTAALRAKPESGPFPILLFTLIVVGMTLQAAVMPRHSLPKSVREARIAAMNRIVERIRLSPKPVISDEMTLIIRAGQDVQWEPAIVAELSNFNLYDEHAFIQKIKNHEFGFFIAEWGPNYSVFLSRYNPQVAEAMTKFYPRKENIGGLTLFLPPISKGRQFQLSRRAAP
jgi:hypothetical protein